MSASSARLREILGLFLLVIASACRFEQPTGSILVQAPNPGSYEIYKIASEEPLQFVSEEIGKYNEALSLSPGRYLVLADCSFEILNVLPNMTQTLIAHQVIFTTPVATSAEDSFSIQCNRFAKTKSRQHLRNRFSLNILHGTRELLVGMIPMSIDFPSLAQKDSPQVLSYPLSGIKVEAYPEMKPRTSFFVSPSDSLLSVTEDQEFGHWQFLLKGRYRVEVNGTKLDVNIGEGQQIVVKPGFLRVSVSPQVNLAANSAIAGSPAFVELNKGHWLDLNETYPVLPGEASLKLNGSQSEHLITLAEGELTEKKVRSVFVDLECSHWDWNCLGSREIFLYETEKPYAFAEGVSDVPLLFFEEEVWLSLQGSKGIRYKIPTHAQDTVLKVGFVKLSPHQLHRPGQITDLSRIEASGAPLSGHSLDLPVDDELIMPLVVGRYFLSQYNASTNVEWDRRTSRQGFTINSGETIELPYYTYVSEKKLKLIREQQSEQRKIEVQKKYRLTQSRFRSIVPARVE